MLKAIRIRVQNFRNDGDWIPIERVTALVGRNESGKTAALKAFHKFNPATPEPYNPQRELGGTKYVGHFAPLFLGQEVRPLVLLDGDDAGRARREALLKELYAAHGAAILLLDDALDRACLGEF